MKVAIHNGMIDVTEIPLFPRIEWGPILDELSAEHIPGLYQHGKRMGVNIENGRPHAYIYVTDKTPPAAKILEILERHGIKNEVSEVPALDMPQPPKGSVVA